MDRLTAITKIRQKQTGTSAGIQKAYKIIKAKIDVRKSRKSTVIKIPKKEKAK